MSGRILRMLGGKAKGKARVTRDMPLSPIGEGDYVRRIELLESFEKANLGWFWATDALGRVIYLSQSAISKLGLTSEDIIGLPLSDLFISANDESDESVRPLRFLLGAHNSISQHCVRAVGEGPQPLWELTGKPHFNGDGEFVGYRGSARDITYSYDARKDVERLAQYDGLTGLSNRHRISKQLTKTLTAFRESKRSCALVMIDLDRFKQVNDTHGHPVGDELLKQVAARLKLIVGEEGEIARLGGDEFQIMLPDLDDRGELADLGQRVVQMVSQPYSIEGSRAIIGASVGIAIAPYDGVETEELVNAADLALYAAKGSGRGKYRFYTSDLRDKAKRRAQIEADLRDAISNDELQMHFQPIVDARSQAVKCVEALIRWEHPTRGWISPGEFIPVAEEVGIIKKIGSWALQRACEDAANWAVDLRVAINVSAVQFQDESFPKIVRQAIQVSGIKPSRVELEITESIFIGDYGRAKKMFTRLKKLGVRLVLDDFGTGYSSLSYLRDAPFDKIKIDQSFVRGCTETGNNNKAIISSIVSLANSLGMETVAEGVETKDELALVREKGATNLQGLIFSGAVSNEDLHARLESGELVYEAIGPDRYRAERRTELRRIGLVHDDHRYNVTLRNLSKSGALVVGLLNVPVATDVVLDLGGGQLAVATVRRSDESVVGLEFETKLIDDGDGGLCTRHRVSPYRLAEVGEALTALTDDAYAKLHGATSLRSSPRLFTEIDVNSLQPSLA